MNLKLTQLGKFLLGLELAVIVLLCVSMLLYYIGIGTVASGFVVYALVTMAISISLLQKWDDFLRDNGEQTIGFYYALCLTIAIGIGYIMVAAGIEYIFKKEEN